LSGANADNSCRVPVSILLNRAERVEQQIRPLRGGEIPTRVSRRDCSDHSELVPNHPRVHAHDSAQRVLNILNRLPTRALLRTDRADRTGCEFRVLSLLRLRNLDNPLQVIHVVVRVGEVELSPTARLDVGTLRLPDGRQHLMDNPALELPCPLLPGAEDQGVQTGLTDDRFGTRHLRVLTKHPAFDLRLLVVFEVSDGLTSLPQPQDVGHVLSAEPRLSVPLNDAELEPLELELLHLSSFIVSVQLSVIPTQGTKSSQSTGRSAPLASVPSSPP